MLWTLPHTPLSCMPPSCLKGHHAKDGQANTGGTLYIPNQNHGSPHIPLAEVPTEWHTHPSTVAPGMGSPDGLTDFPGYCRWFPLILRKFLCVGEGSVKSLPQHLCPIPKQAQKACRRSAGPVGAQ